MLRVTLKGLLAHRLRLALTMSAIVIGVAFVAGSFLLTDSVDDAFSNLLVEVNAGTDLIVRPIVEVQEEGPPTFTNAPRPLDGGLADVIADVAGVASSFGNVTGPAQIIDPNGEPMGGNGPPVLGVSWADEGPLSIRAGRPPTARGEVVIDARTAEAGPFAPGDDITIVVPSGAETFTVVGVAGFGSSDNFLGATLAAFEVEEARRALGKIGQFDEVNIAVADDADVRAVRAAIADVLPEHAEVIPAQQSIDEQLSDIRQFLSIINGALLGFAFIAMFVGAFIIANTFSIIVAQRTREFALLRALGATGQQIRRVVRVEAVVVGLVGSMLGLLAGIGFSEGLKVVLDAFGLGIPTGGLIVATRTVVAAFVVGVGVTVAAARGPARRASRVPPVEALRASATDDAPLGRRSLVGAGAVTAGAVVFGMGLLGVWNGAILVAAGAVTVLLGVTALSPLLAGPVARVLGRVPARFGPAGRIARGNAARDTRRTGTTASALMVGLALVTFATVFAASVNGSIGDTLQAQFGGDFVISTGNPGFYDLPPTLADDLAPLPEVGALARVRIGQMALAGETLFVAGVDAEAIAAVIELDVIEGEVSGLGEREVFLTPEAAADRSLTVGDTVEVAFTAGGTARYTVAGLYGNAELVQAPALVSRAEFEASFANQLDALVLVNASEGTSLSDARSAIEAVTVAYPNAQVQDQAELREDIEGQINQVLGLMTVLLALAIIVALIGITNTLALAVFERTREIGLLRAVGMSRRQVRSMIRWESTIVAIFGAILGVVIGAIFGWAIVRSLADEGFERLVLPVGQLLMYVFVAGLAGVAAAAFPARRAARLDVLAAVTHE